ncbi:ABC transporter ATP-binding protein [Hahella sp. HN01]|uniref:ABC transporter ATP-binding protein n=1 Tax=Hahella sp. HN01 TaxID=2847262 RepID=UPI001C1F1BEA|nr:ABC transporter ATP-binding protein [Hahella sp. HN01]MBU6953764.1 ABC transporter ATP-binding protein [Hahella sp. HN01]
MSDPVTTSFDLECRNVRKNFAAFTAVNDVSFQIPQGSFFSILGPSGCGKTTLLRMLAGFQQPDAGDILIKGRSVLDTPPNKRPVNMVFQHLALFPNMTVAENVAYGLRRRKAPRHEIETAVKDMLARVGLPDSGGKRIDQLSGGQKQRIAIARCLVLRPDVLLLDEPLGALDLKLREQMKVELKHLQEKFGTTFVYITHDQSEALVMSDHIAVMNKGRFEQVGTPQELYYQPDTAFVASFVGDSNCWRGTLVSRDSEGAAIRTASGLQFRVEGALENLQQGQEAQVYLRPEAVKIELASASSHGDAGAGRGGENCFSGVVDAVLFDGARSQVQVSLDHSSESISVALPQTPMFHNIGKGQRVLLSWAAGQCSCFPV